MKKVIIIVVLILLSAGAAWMIDEKPFSKAKEENVRVLSSMEIWQSSVIETCKETDFNSEEDGALFFATAINEVYPHLKDLTGYNETFKFVQDIINHTEKYSFYMYKKVNRGIIRKHGSNQIFSIHAFNGSTDYGFYESNQKDHYATMNVLPDGVTAINPEKIAKLIQQ